MAKRQIACAITEKKQIACAITEKKTVTMEKRQIAMLSWKKDS